MACALGFRLLAITPPTGPVDPALVDAWAVGRAVGIAVLLREPGASAATLVGEGHRLEPLRRACARVGIPCLLSVDPSAVPTLGSTATMPGIAGVQLRGDPTEAELAVARERLPEGHVLGRSCHGRPAAMGERVDYSVLAPIFAPRTASTTPGPGKRAVGLEPLREFARRERHVFALGGVTGARAEACRGAGAFGLAAIRTFFGPPADVTDNVAHLARALAEPDDDAPPPP